MGKPDVQFLKALASGFCCAVGFSCNHNRASRELRHKFVLEISDTAVHRRGMRNLVWPILVRLFFSDYFNLECRLC